MRNSERSAVILSAAKNPAGFMKRSASASQRTSESVDLLHAGAAAAVDHPGLAHRQPMVVQWVCRQLSTWPLQEPQAFLRQPKKFPHINQTTQEGKGWNHQRCSKIAESLQINRCFSSCCHTFIYIDEF